MKLSVAICLAFAIVGVSLAADCGHPAVQPNTQKIVGGTTATPHSWPWQVALYTKSFLGSWYQFCGGSVINENWILTAGHCFYGHGNIANYKVIAGAQNLKQSEPEQQTVTLKNIFVNPQYDQQTTTHDSTLLQLATPLKLTDAVSPVCLANPGSSLPDGTVAWITGWGSTREGGQTTATLMQTDVPIVNHDTCAKEYQGEQTVDDTMICAGYEKGGHDTCQGDSGGPLVSNVNGSWTQFGITSWGQGCAEAGYAGVYGSVAAMRDFIDSTIAANSK